MGLTLFVIFGSILLGTAIFVALTFLLSWLVFPGSGSRGPHDTLVGGIVGSLLVLLAEWLSTIWTVVCLPFRTFRSRSKEKNLLPNQVPVALLPGFLENTVTMALLKFRVQHELNVPVKTLTPIKYFTGLEVLAGDYHRQILNWMNELGAKQIDLVGHSMGGLLARSLVEKNLLPGRIRRVITIGSPHHGSAISIFGFLIRALRQMKRGSAYLEELNSFSPPNRFEIIGICSTHDNLVLPWNLALSPKGDNFIIRFVGHQSMIMSQEVARLVVQLLKDQPGLSAHLNQEIQR